MKLNCNNFLLVASTNVIMFINKYYKTLKVILFVFVQLYVHVYCMYLGMDKYLGVPFSMKCAKTSLWTIMCCTKQLVCPHLEYRIRIRISTLCITNCYRSRSKLFSCQKAASWTKPCLRLIELA